MKYLTEVNVSFGDKRKLQEIKRVLMRHGVGFSVSSSSVVIPLEKTDKERLERIIAELKAIGRRPLVLHRPSFTTEELENAELLVLRVYSFCGDSFETWVKRLGLPLGNKVMDKNEMGDLDIAKTYAWREYVISRRFIGFLEADKMTGWQADRISHYQLTQEQLPELFHLTAVNELPPLDPETEVEVDRHENLEVDDPLYATTALFEVGPLMYRESDLRHVEDFNRTHEVFLEAPMAHSYMIVRQRVRRMFLANKLRGDVLFEPVIVSHKLKGE